MTLRLLFLLVLLSALLVACKPADQPPPTSAPAPLAEALKVSSSLALHEGLPHPSFEQDLFDAEKKSKPFKDIQGHAFYQESISLQPQDYKVISDILNNPSAYKPFVEGKKCGGFHPDYALEFQSAPDKSTWALLCFGCKEIKIIGPQTNQQFDLDSDTSEKLQTALKPYRKNRPSP